MHINLIFFVGVSLFIPLALYKSHIEQPDFEWGWSYYIGWVGFMFTLLSFSVALRFGSLISKLVKEYLANIELNQDIEDESIQEENKIVE